jgi:hypothetical protein
MMRGMKRGSMRSRKINDWEKNPQMSFVTGKLSVLRGEYLK